ncbi:NlpC/P60 family protein [Streptomyces lateritius]|uniref:C40 family peptidase n=1 Tax=Streptomyces lateritius TaxID=67313 RepID=UPI002892E8E6|nr:NlpC/P60 family protein [Streptomyces lateritius]
MSRRLLRTVCAGALAAATAFTGVALQAGVTAPDPPADPPMAAPIGRADPAAKAVGPVDPDAAEATGTPDPGDSGAPDVPDIPDTPDTPGASDGSGDSEDSDAPEPSDSSEDSDTPESSDAPDAAEGSGTPETSDALDAPVAPDASADPDAPVDPETSDTPEAPDVPDAPSVPGGPEEPDAPDVPDVPNVPEEPGTPDVPDATPLAPLDDGAALPPPGGDSVAALLTRMRTLYQRAEEAAERYNAADEALKRQTADTKKVTARLTAARNALAQGRAVAGRIARDQYQGRSELSSYLRVLLAPDPRAALDQGHLIARATRERAAAVSRLERAERQAGSLASASRKALDRQQSLAVAQRTRRDEARARLGEVEKLLAALSPGQLARLTELERVQTAGAQRDLLDSGVLDGRRTPSRAGAEALRFAVGQIGKPYEWGAEGPETYDCSGLTQKAWAAAGQELPRTSQEQWATLPRVRLTELRPGDLVVYFPGATHVAVYLGEGLVVHAPRPGGKVKVSPIAANPLLGAVRPDPDGEALGSYTPPVLPAGARDGDDQGYDRA